MSLEKTFARVHKEIRLWATWKLKCPNMLQDGSNSTTWQNMSKHDQEFNLLWNKLLKIGLTITLPKLKKLVTFAEGL